MLVAIKPELPVLNSIARQNKLANPAAIRDKPLNRQRPDRLAAK
ncbi:hypothetical protein JCM19233_6922 [Vibrio astriarenae]|nr:hypothetical protein JCM19233_6922 [Vibrio sp. C7]